MINLYFGNTVQFISTVLIILSSLSIAYILKYRKTIAHWGRTFLYLFVIGLLMSIISGTRDSIGEINGFPTQGFIFFVLCLLGTLGAILGVIALLSKIFKTNIILNYGSYILMLIIIIKTILVEVSRIYPFII